MVWLSFIARNSAISRLRARGRRLTVSDYPRVLVADDANLSGELFIFEEKAENRWREIKGLPDPEQTYVPTAYLCGLNTSQVAEDAGVSLGTKTRMRPGSQGTARTGDA